MTDRHPDSRTLRRAVALGLLCTLLACGDTAQLAPEAGMGPAPELPPPHQSLIPTIHVATAVGWPAGVTPDAAPGLAVNAFATGLEHPRWVYPLPNGDVLVAETNAPPRPDDGTGIRGWFMRKFMKRAGAAVPSPNRIVLLRDADGDGVAERRTLFIGGLNSPFGMALVDSVLYIADTDALIAFRYHTGDTMLTGIVGKVTALPAGRINHHWTKNVIASADGKRLYVTVGSNSNAAENGIEQETNRAAILEVNPATGATRIFASGLRNPNGLAWEPVTGALWTAVNERDEIGSDLVPDYMTAVRDGGFYGWPYSYYGQHIDTRVSPQRPDLVASALVPDYALGAHTASLGLAFDTGSLLPAHYRGGAFIGQHGSWNRKPFNGYRVIFVPFSAGKPNGPAEDVLTGFLSAEGKARGRPVGVAIDRSGALLVADDVGNVVWRVVAGGR
ncbi:MAG: sorbosone dehydrogenase family protein [Gemmatimonadota bacterium]